MTGLDEAKAALDRQTEKGLRKYGAILDDQDLTPLDLVQHAIEEAADSLLYLVAMKRRLEAENVPEPSE